MSFLTSREITLSEKLTRVVKAPFRTSGLGQDVMNDLEYVCSFSPHALLQIISADFVLTREATLPDYQVKM